MDRDYLMGYSGSYVYSTLEKVNLIDASYSVHEHYAHHKIHNDYLSIVKKYSTSFQVSQYSIFGGSKVETSNYTIKVNFKNKSISTTSFCSNFIIKGSINEDIAIINFFSYNHLVLSIKIDYSNKKLYHYIHEDSYGNFRIIPNEYMEIIYQEFKIN